MKLLFLSIAYFIVANLDIFTFVAAEAGGPSNKCQVVNKRTGNLQHVDCELHPETVEGPYYVPVCLNRQNITEGEPGLQLVIDLVIMNTLTCEPLANVSVDIWHANSTGFYSGFQSEGTYNLTFLRGYQVTNENGEVQFSTIYPGWYVGRCIHIHIEVFIGGQLKHIGQLYFPNIYTNAVRFLAPYNTNTVELLRNEDDWIFNGQGGSQTVFPNPDGNTDSGFYALGYVGVNPNATVTP